MKKAVDRKPRSRRGDPLFGRRIGRKPRISIEQAPGRLAEEVYSEHARRHGEFAIARRKLGSWSGWQSEVVTEGIPAGCQGPRLASDRGAGARTGFVRRKCQLLTSSSTELHKLPQHPSKLQPTIRTRLGTNLDKAFNVSGKLRMTQAVDGISLRNRYPIRH